MNTQFKKSAEWLNKAKELMPSAAQTYSKSYRYFCEGAAPVFLDHGEGSHVWDIDGNEYIDFICALGPITIGYNNKEVNKAVVNQLKKGISFSQSTVLEVQLAEKLTKIIPSAEMVRFVKNGADATSAAIRLARAYTKKDVVLASGYHGCQDWYIGSTINDLGVPKAVKNLIKTFEYNDINSLKKLFLENKNKVAAVIMEPMQENGPKKGYLEEVKRITHDNGALLVFDEIVSGFRMALGGAQEYFKVIPDLSAFGKGMGNGLPVSVIVGKKKVMKLIDEGAFISFTFGGETLSLAGALTTIKLLENPKSFKKIWALGNRLKKGFQESIEKKNIFKIAKIVGAAPHCGIIFLKTGNLSDHDLFSVFQQTLIRGGILTLGINNFCLAHTKKDVDTFIKAADKAFDDVILAVKKNSVKGILLGKKFRPIFKRN
ncbi:MAG: aminotransferase class III-fold pyridoxal phosphate-dependent enzyme [Nanoarchaeota archaeon]|nr:aminotransferase class III-fold pyridoxal phosphate-dependent enzyme [Nanoarchaeota archaeon]MBU1029963.1 aminotransferase class III-fold pyridoxal phosphate-dependent enzyme [Nanoarchaeota archaeon]MBU1850361.1 aminotransferase class III-fold pyridoxal phosphate-dependent enzyme [Nanoarchaeota archaeon]